jgi:integrase
MARPFTEIELEKTLESLRSEGRDRDALLLEMGSSLGFRISELLSLKVDKVAENRIARSEIIVSRRNLKGGKGARRRSVHNRRIIVPERLRRALTDYLGRSTLFPGSYLFQSREGGNRPIGRSQAHRIIVGAANAAGVCGRIATHSMRKSFVKRIYALSDHDLIKTQRIVGHRSPLTTARYLETDQADLDALVRAQDRLFVGTTMQETAFQLQDCRSA